MAQAWPITLEQLLNTSGFGKEYGDAVLRSDMDVGMAKLRNRYTKAIDTYSASIIATEDQLVIFENFYKGTLANGVLPFTFNDPITKLPTDFRFKGVPRSVPLGTGGIYWTISFTWEKLP